MTKVINLFAGPGAGKSTTAAGLFHELKCRDIKCELVTEYAKDMTYEKRQNILSDQLYILAKQNRRLSRLVGHVDYIITDSPLLLGLAYVPGDYYSSFEPLVTEIFESYDNQNIVLLRRKKYQAYGRNQTEEQAIEKDNLIFDLVMHKYPTMCIPGDREAPTSIIKYLGIE
jgi:hypothetical protein